MTSKAETEILYDRLAKIHPGALYRLASATEFDADKRQDLIQIMHLELWQSLSGFRGQCSEKTRTYRVIHNVVASWARKQSRQRFTSLELSTAETLPDMQDIHDSMETRQALERLNAWIEKLKMPDKQILLLYLEDCSAAEIAEIIGMSPGAIATRISRLKSKLSHHFKG